MYRTQLTKGVVYYVYGHLEACLKSHSSVTVLCSPVSSIAYGGAQTMDSGCLNSDHLT